MPCALLGDRASGKTTFLGLLYSAQVKYGTGVQDDFRFHAPIQSLNLMSAVYEGMKDGRFPSATLKEEITELGFVFGYLRKVVGKLPYYIRQQNWVQPFSTLRFSAYDVSGEDIEEFIDTGIASRPLIQQLLKSVVVVVLVDCSKMTTEVDTAAYKKMLRYDSTVAKLLVAFQTYKKQEYDRLKDSGVKADAPRIYPAFVLAKFDTLKDDVLARLGLHLMHPVRGGREILLSGITRGPPDEAGRPTFANHTAVARTDVLRSGRINLDAVYRAMNEFDRRDPQIAGEMALLQVPPRSEEESRMPFGSGIHKHLTFPAIETLATRIMTDPTSRTLLLCRNTTPEARNTTLNLIFELLVWSCGLPIPTAISEAPRASALNFFNLVIAPRGVRADSTWAILESALAQPVLPRVLDHDDVYQVLTATVRQSADLLSAR